MGVSIVRQNLMSHKGYTPYCGCLKCRTMPRTRYDDKVGQFSCPACGWISGYEPEFIKEWKAKWGY